MKKAASRLARSLYRVRHNNSTLINLFFILTSIILLSSVAFYFFEKSSGQSNYSNYFEALKGILVLLFSGFDVSPPQTVMGYGAALLVMICGIVLVAVLFGETAATLVDRAMKARKGLKKVKASNHILICNWNEHGAPIIDELLNDESGISREIVIVADLEEVPYDSPRVKFVKGNPMSEDVLGKAEIMKACTAIVLGIQSADKCHIDSSAVLTALAVESVNPDVYTCVMVEDIDSKKHLSRANVDEIVCISEMTDGIIVQSTLNHGLSRLFSELLSFTDGAEIYKVRIPEDYEGITFLAAAARMAQESKATLLAIEKASNTNGDGDRAKIIVTPDCPELLKSGDSAFVISETFPKGFKHA